jgi:predicted SAM-dependent methyltransferase
MSQRYHLGCGGRRLDGYTNVDVVQTPAVDLVADLSRPEFPEPGDAFFSHAFFEHLRRDSRIPHLRAVRRAATDDGFACYLGLPDFRRIAELYLERGPGAVGPVFDLYNVYRYTHGDPEMNPDPVWDAQLHKSLFDVDEVGRLLRDAGWSSYVVFRYVFPSEAPVLNLNLGFYATAAQRSVERLQQDALAYLSEFDGRFISLETLAFENGRSRPAMFARATGVPQRRLVKRVAYATAAVLARNTHPA